MFLFNLSSLLSFFLSLSILICQHFLFLLYISQCFFSIFLPFFLSFFLYLFLSVNTFYFFYIYHNVSFPSFFPFVQFFHSIPFLHFSLFFSQFFHCTIGLICCDCGGFVFWPCCSKSSLILNLNFSLHWLTTIYGHSCYLLP